MGFFVIFFLLVGSVFSSPPDRTEDLRLLYGSGTLNQSYTIGLAVPSMEEGNDVKQGHNVE